MPDHERLLFFIFGKRYRRGVFSFDTGLLWDDDFTGSFWRSVPVKVIYGSFLPHPNRIIRVSRRMAGGRLPYADENIPLPFFASHTKMIGSKGNNGFGECNGTK